MARNPIRAAGNPIRFQKNSNPGGSSGYPGGVKLYPGAEIYLSGQIGTQSESPKTLSVLVGIKEGYRNE
ncbi:MAG TPA: hypothetical protein P5210_00345 [Draconibacterium sp.]|nr:hypothetical protein [Draconibacterium sp.]HRX10061.1 hypothetical protein [Draconibacterium sp.]